MTANPDFEYIKPLSSVVEHLRTLVAPHPELAHETDRIVADLETRDRHLEDWLNRNTVRRVLIAQALGDNTVHASATWEDVGPAMFIAYPKASPRSSLAVRIDANGLYADGAPPHYVDLGVRITGPAGFDVEYGVVRKTGDVNPQEMTHAGGKLVAVGARAGTYQVQLRVQVQTAGVTWTSTPNNTFSLTVIETATG